MPPFCTEIPKHQLDSLRELSNALSVFTKCQRHLHESANCNQSLDNLVSFMYEWDRQMFTYLDGLNPVSVRISLIPSNVMSLL